MGKFNSALQCCVCGSALPCEKHDLRAMPADTLTAVGLDALDERLASATDHISIPINVQVARALVSVARSSLATPEWPITVDGPNEVGNVRRWLARQLMDSKLTEEESLGIVAHHPSISASSRAYAASASGGAQSPQ